MSHKFDPARAERLNDPERLAELDPRVMWDAAGVPSPKDAIDIGAGTGLITSAFARLAPSSRFYAADVSPDMLAWMRDHLPADVAGRIEPVLATETNVPLPDAAADVVTMIALYHELEHPAQTLADVRRLLRPGGRVLIVDWKKQPTPHGPEMSMRVSAADIAGALSEAGFEQVAIHDVLEAFSVVTATRP